jgi:hypothetical protein
VPEDYATNGGAVAAAMCWQDQVGGVWGLELGKGQKHQISVAGTYLCPPDTPLCTTSGVQFYGMALVDGPVARLVLTIHYSVVHPVDRNTWIY